MNMEYICFIVPLLIATITLLVKGIWEKLCERPIKTLNRVLKALLLSLAVTTIAMLTSDVEYITLLYFGIMTISLFFFFTVLIQFLLSYKSTERRKKIASILVVLLMVFLSATVASRNHISIELIFYEVSVVVMENGTGSQEDVVLYIPLPEGCPEGFVSFGKENYSVISTEHGRMLSLSTGTNLILHASLVRNFKDRHTTFWEYAPSVEPDLTACSGNKAYFFLQNTSRNVSVNLYFEVHQRFAVSRKYYYMAVGTTVYSIDDSDPNPCLWVLGSAKLPLTQGWNEMELLRGGYELSFYAPSSRTDQLHSAL